MMRIPRQLQNPFFRFYRVGKNSKLPIDKRWNDDNNFIFNEEGLRRHRGNYGVATGFGDLIVLDFDSREFYEKVADLLPKTFTVVSAGKRLPHMYYILTDEMFKKTSVKDENNNTLCDVQAERAGVVAPNSHVNRRYYDVVHDIDIAEISTKQLQEVLGIHTKKHVPFKGDKTPKPHKVQETMNILKLLNITQTTSTHFQCPFHPMNGKGNLTVMDTGALYCFNEQKCWKDVFKFAEQYCKDKPKLMRTVQIFKTEMKNGN